MSCFYLLVAAFSRYVSLAIGSMAIGLYLFSHHLKIFQQPLLILFSSGGYFCVMVINDGLLGKV